MDVSFTRLETVSAEIEGKTRYVLILGNREIYENFIFPDEELLDLWVKHLSKYCIFGQIQNYYIERGGVELGKGSMAEVAFGVSAFNPKEWVVIKKYKEREFSGIKDPLKLKKFVEDKELHLTHFKGEIFALRKLNHPNIMKIREVFEYPNTKIIVADFMEGGDFYQYMKKNNHVINYREALEYIFGLLLALNHMEKHRIVHRDIKQGNLVLKYIDGSQNIALIDFGFAICLDDFPPGTPLPRKFGTVGCYAPEVLQGKTMFDTKADVYSAGVLLFSLIAGCQPYRSESPNSRMHRDELIRKNTIGDIDWSPLDDPHLIVQEIPASVRKLIEKMLTFDPNDRPLASRLLSDDAFKILSTPGKVPNPLTNRKYHSTISIEEDPGLHVNIENEAEVSEVSKNSIAHLNED